MVIQKSHQTSLKMFNNVQCGANILTDSLKLTNANEMTPNDSVPVTLI